MRKSIAKEDLKPTLASLEKAQKICSDNKGGQELTAEISALFPCLKYAYLNFLCVNHFINKTVLHVVSGMKCITVPKVAFCVETNYLLQTYSVISADCSNHFTFQISSGG